MPTVPHVDPTMSEQEIYDYLYKTIIVKDEITHIGQMLKRSAQLYPDVIALICEDKSMSYRALYYYAMLLSKRLAQAGVKPRDRVLLLYENSMTFYVAYFAIIQLGAVVAPLNTFLHERELAHIIADAKPVRLITSSDRAQKLKEFARTLPPIIDETMIDLESVVPDRLPDFSPTPLPFEEMAALLYTSGTTGFPKGVMLSSKNILTNVLQVGGRFKIVEPQRILAILPLFHVLAQNVCVWVSILIGCTIIVVPKIERRGLLKGLSHKPTIFVGVPALFGLLALLKTAPLDSIDYFFSGGDALPDKIRAAFELIYRRKLCNGYGISEASPIVSVDMDDVAETTSNAGKPLYGVSVAIRDEENHDLAPNHIGLIWLKGDTIMLGYYQAPEVTKACFRDGWFNTGDLGYLDADGKLVITGREKDLIAHKGIKIYPQEVENIIMLDPNVIAVGVVGLQDISVGEVPVAYVQVRHEDAQTEHNIRELCKNNLAIYKIPRHIECSTKVLPMTATGKVDKKVLRKWVKELEKREDE
jgi:long-chain acyl-CoA synthetase